MTTPMKKLPERDRLLGQWLGEEFRRFDQRISELQKRLVEIETRGIEYCGTFQRAVGYRKGSCVTFDGSMWVAVVGTEPNESPKTSSKWVLCVKAGVNGKDADDPTRRHASHSSGVLR
jgi:hypothetical protein